MSIKIAPLDLYKRLINESKILTSQGKITFAFSNVDIVVCQRDVVGNIVQEWLEGWLKKNDIEYSTNENTQMPPDFFLDPSNKKHHLLEVKAFNFEATPGFDIADFRMYEEELITKPWMLDVDYLIFGYEMSPSGQVSIKRLWLKKVWEITSSSSDWPLKLQVKKNVVHKIRPCNWYSEFTQFVVFNSKEDFLSAIEETVFRNPATHNSGGTWRNDFLRSYKNYYGVDLNIKHWDEIKDKYQNNKKLNKLIENYVGQK
jgi:type II restriction enzyme